MTNDTASLPADNRHPPRRGRRLLIALLALIVLTLLGLDRAYRYAVRPERLVRLTEEHLSRFVAGQVRIGDARLALFEGIRLMDVTIDLPDSTTNESVNLEGAQATPPVFTCRRVDLRHRPLALLLGKLQIESVTAFEPTCTIVHDDATGLTNISRLIPPAPDPALTPAERRPHREAAAAQLPTVELRDASLRVLNRRKGELHEVEHLALSIRARPASDDPGRYDVVWNARAADEIRQAQATPDSSSGGHSQIDLNTGYVRNIYGGLPSMSIEAVMLAINARYDGVGAWTNLLGLGGRVRAVDYNLINDPDGHDDRSVTIELTDAAISIPVDAAEHPLPHGQRYLRFSRVNGTVVATTEALRAEFTGDFHGARCFVRATLRSDLEELRSLDDVDFDVDLTVNGLHVPRIDDDAPPEQIRFVRRFPALHNAYADFDPHGIVNLDIRARKKAGADEPVTLQTGTIDLLDGDAAFQYFPYRGHGMTGTIEFLPEGVFVRELTGHRDGGVITINGWMAAPSECAELKFDIAGKNVPIDDALVQALEPEHRITAARFQPQGRLDIDVELIRHACEADERKGRWSTTVTLHLQDNRATYEDFPYPIEGIAGTIIIEPGRTRVLNVRGRPRAAPSAVQDQADRQAPHALVDSADIHVHGAVLFDEDQVTDIDIVIQAQNVPVDENLHAALPASMGERLRAFRPTGTFQCTTTLSFDPIDQSPRHDSTVSLDGLSLRHELFPITFSDVRGTLRIEPHLIHADRITAHYQDSVVIVNGSIDPLDPKQHTSITIEANRLKPNDELRDTFASAWERLGDWHIDGPLDLSLQVHTDDADSSKTPETIETGPWNLAGTARLHGATVQHKGRPLYVTDVNGVVSFASDSIRGRNLTGRFNEAAIQLDFEVKTAEAKQLGTFRVAASKIKLGPDLRALLPERLRAGWDRLSPYGPVDLLIDNLEFVKSSDDKPPIWTAQGRINMLDVGIRGETNIEGATGYLTFGGTLSDRLGGCMVSGRLHLERAVLLERQLRRFESGWSLVQTAGGEGRFTLSQAQAELYDGFIAGDVEVMMGPDQTTYNMTTTIQRAKLDLMLNDGRRLSPEPAERVTIHGLLDAQLYLSGTWGERASRRGGGRLELSAGHIYKLPIMSAILHVLNLSLPLESSLESAQASFFVIGNRVDLPDVALRGSGLELAGSGSMTLPDYALDVTLVSVNPRRWARVPLLSDIVEGASREFVVLHVTGPIGRPTVRTRPLASLDDEVRRLFQRRGASPVRAVPSSE